MDFKSVGNIFTQRSLYDGVVGVSYTSIVLKEKNLLFVKKKSFFNGVYN